jgi:hypothetical protein
MSAISRRIRRPTNERPAYWRVAGRNMICGNGTPKPPKELDAIADIVLAYRPKAKSKPGKKRRRMQKRLIAAQALAESEGLRKVD